MNTSWQTLEVPWTADIPVRVRASERPDAPLVVLCHGMGEDPALAEKSWPQVLSLDVHAVIPGGPFAFEQRGDTGIRIGRGWYLYDGGDDPFRSTATASRDWVCRTLESIESQLGLHPRERALAGYSQGAYFGAFVALTRQDLFSRLVLVAGRIKEEFVADALIHPGVFQTLILHGSEDAHVLPEAAESSRAFLERAGYPATVHMLPRGHRLHADRDRAAAAWLGTAWPDTRS